MTTDEIEFLRRVASDYASVISELDRAATIIERACSPARPESIQDFRRMAKTSNAMLGRLNLTLLEAAPPRTEIIRGA